MRAWPSPLAALLLTAMLGCRPDLTRETAAVESLVPVIDNVSQRIARIDTVAAQELAERISFQCSRIAADSLLLGESLGASFSVHCGLPDRVRQLLDHRNELAAEAIRTKSQLHDLRTDLTNRIANKDSVSAFIEVEFLYVEHLGEMADELEARLEELFRIGEAFRPKMDSLMTVTTAKFVE